MCAKEYEQVRDGKTQKIAWHAEQRERSKIKKAARRAKNEQRQERERRVPRKKQRGRKHREKREYRSSGRDQKDAESCPLHGPVGHGWMQCRRNVDKKPWPGLSAWNASEGGQKKVQFQGRRDDRRSKTEHVHHQDDDSPDDASYDSRSYRDDREDREDREDIDSRASDDESTASSKGEENFVLDYVPKSRSSKRSNAGRRTREKAQKPKRRKMASEHERIPKKHARKERRERRRKTVANPDQEFDE